MQYFFQIAKIVMQDTDLDVIVAGIYLFEIS